MTEEKKKGRTSDDFIKHIFGKRYQSVWVAILGRNQSGKTDFALWLLTQINKLKLGNAFGANVPGLDTSKLKNPFDIEFIEDFETLKKRCQMLNPNPQKHGIKRYFFLGDEMGNWAPQDQPWLNVKFIRELQQVRKYGLCFIGTAIDRVDERILNEKHFHGYFMKSKRNLTIAKYFNWMTYNTVDIIGIKRTKIDFDTWYSATFHMEPQIDKEIQVPLNTEHRMIMEYLEKGKSWDKTEFKRWQGKIAIDKVLQFHMSTCLHAIQQEQVIEDSHESQTRTEVSEKVA
jgi:Zonular occludens toxin (Zot).